MLKFTDLILEVTFGLSNDFKFVSQWLYSFNCLCDYWVRFNIFWIRSNSYTMLLYLWFLNRYALTHKSIKPAFSALLFTTEFQVKPDRKGSVAGWMNISVQPGVLTLNLGAYVKRVVAVDLSHTSMVFLPVVRFSSLHKINT